jgi:hypothetical protein
MACVLSGLDETKFFENELSRKTLTMWTEARLELKARSGIDGYRLSLISKNYCVGEVFGELLGF